MIPKKANKLTEGLKRDLSYRGKWAKYGKPKYVMFGESCQKLGLEVWIYQAKTTVSKYIFVTNGDTVKKIRFSNHRPNTRQQENQDSDFYVGVSNGHVTTTEDALAWVKGVFLKKGLPL